MVVAMALLLAALLALSIGRATSSPSSPRRPSKRAFASNGSVITSSKSTCAAIPAFACLGPKKFQRPRHDNYLTNSNNLALAASCDDGEQNNDQIGCFSQPRQMVITRAPSRHTYGFMHDTNYDLPMIELRNLISSDAACDVNDIQFVPVDGANLQNPEQKVKGLEEAKSRNQSKKKKSKKSHHVPSLHWIECADELTSDKISKAASNAILTHATFSINHSCSYGGGDWERATNDCSTDASSADDSIFCSKVFEQMDVIDMSNTNMSRNCRSELIQRASYLIKTKNPELQSSLTEYFPAQTSSYTDDIECSGDTQNQERDQTYKERGLEPVLIHHCIDPTQEQQLKHEQQKQSTHILYFGYRTAIGPAGTRGAPSQTLRRTHRGLLKEYALKNRKVLADNDTGASESVVKERSSTSTAMEPEIGFLMASFALAGTKLAKGGGTSRVLDPCCGSGSLLLYAAALGANELVGIDSDPSVWKDAEYEFQSHHVHDANDGKYRALAVPTFFQGDVQNPSSTEALSSPDSFDAIICDPPYNIGAPVLVDGRDERPRNYHNAGEDRDDSVPISNKNCEPTLPVTTDLVCHIIAIARKVLVNGGRLVFFLPVRGREIHIPLEKLLLSKGCSEYEVSQKVGEDLESDSLRLLTSYSRLQHFSPTFCRWMVCMEKRSNIY